jgi:glycogen debranching enzyme
MTFAGEVPHSPYYGSVDSTLLYMMLFAETIKWTDSQELFDELWGSVRKALDWAWQWGDADGDGYIEFSARSNRGIRHQGWKDSDESLGGVVGPRPKPPIALVEVQGYYYAALTGVAEVLRRYGGRVAEQAKGALSDKLIKQALALKTQFNRDFWSDATGFYVHALDGSKAQVPDVTSNVGHCLWTGIVDEGRAAQVVARLMQPDMLSGWGVRTMSANDVTYNPMSYHNGSIWPHDNAILVAGLRRYNFGAEMVKVATEVLDAATTFEGYRLPELYCGFARGEGIERESAPAAYPVSCSPQAWAAGSSLMILQALLGIEIEAGTSSMSTAPLLPGGVTKVHLRGMRVADNRLDLDVDDIKHSGHNAVGTSGMTLVGRDLKAEK